jgi:hypothetical protein
MLQFEAKCISLTLGRQLTMKVLWPKVIPKLRVCRKFFANFPNVQNFCNFSPNRCVWDVAYFANDCLRTGKDNSAILTRLHIYTCNLRLVWIRSQIKNSDRPSQVRIPFRLSYRGNDTYIFI